MTDNTNIEKLVFNIFVFVVSLAFFALGAPAIETYVETVVKDRATLVASMQATFLFMYYILVPIVRFAVFALSPERRAVGYFIEMFSTGKDPMRVSIFRIRRAFFSGELALEGIVYYLATATDLEFKYLGGWSSNNLRVRFDADAKNVIGISYFYKGFFSASAKSAIYTESASVQRWGMTDFFLRPENMGGGSFWDLDEKPQRMTFFLYKVSAKSLLAAFPKGNLSSIERIKYTFTDALMKESEKPRQLFNAWLRDGWSAPWSNDHMRRTADGWCQRELGH